MDRPAFIAPGIAVAAALTPADFADLARQGFKAVVSNRPDGEEDGQLSGRDEAVLAWRAGLTFRHVPTAKHEVLDACAVSRLSRALGQVPRPVLLHCKSGQRSAILLAAARVSHEPVDVVLADLAAGGVDLSVLRDELEDIARSSNSTRSERAAA